MSKKTYYDISSILATDANYMMLLGKRANGKSYQVKKTVIMNAYENGKRFVLLRRWREDIKVKAIIRYFDDMPIKKMTNGKYDGITAYGGNIYFYVTDLDSGKQVKIEPEIGIYCSLNEAERYKSWALPDYDSIIYEEFITDGVYLNDEPRLLQQFVSTVARDRKIRVFLIGNTLSRVCPYFTEWCLDGVLNQKIGTIELYHFHVEDNTIDIAVEYCANTNNGNKMFFGHAAKQIISGEWDTKDLPRLPKKQYEYEKVYEILVKYQSFKFVIELLVEPKAGGTICFVYPFTGTRKFNRILSDEITDDPFITNRLKNIRPEKIISECFRLNKVYYSDNLTGADFSHVISNFNI